VQCPGGRGGSAEMRGVNWFIQLFISVMVKLNGFYALTSRLDCGANRGQMVQNFRYTIEFVNW